MLKFQNIYLIDSNHKTYYVFLQFQQSYYEVTQKYKHCKIFDVMISKFQPPANFNDEEIRIK